MISIYQKRGGVLRKFPAPEPVGQNDVPVATSSTPGLVMPDNETVSVGGDGILSAKPLHVDGQVSEVLQKPVLVRTFNLPEYAVPAVFEVVGTPTIEGTKIASFFWVSDENRSERVPADGNRAIFSVQHSRKHGQDVKISIECCDSLGYVSQHAEFSHTVDVTSELSPHGEILADSSGNPVAVKIGSFSSRGAEPWNIFGKKVWLAVATARYRTNANFGWDGVLIPNAELYSSSGSFLARSTIGPDCDGNRVSVLSTEENMDRHYRSDSSQDSTRKTDILLQSGYPRSSPPNAAKHCRTVKPVVGGKATPMDLPRISVLARIYQARELIDLLDPTLSEMPSSYYSLKSWNRCIVGDNIRTGQFYSSTIPVSGNHIRGDSSTVFDNSGYATTLFWRDLDDGYCVLPVLEIPAE